MNGRPDSKDDDLFVNGDKRPKPTPLDWEAAAIAAARAAAPRTYKVTGRMEVVNTSGVRGRNLPVVFSSPPSPPRK